MAGMKKGTKQILLIGGLAVGGYFAYSWWQGRQAASAEAAAYYPSGYGAGGGFAGSGLGGGMGLDLGMLLGPAPCGPDNEGVPEEGGVAGVSTAIGGYTTEDEKIALLGVEAAYRQEYPLQFFAGVPGRYLTPTEYARRAALVPARLPPTEATIAATAYARQQAVGRAESYAQRAAEAGAIRLAAIEAAGAGTRYLSAEERYRRASGVAPQKFVAGVPTRYMPPAEFARRTALVTPPPVPTVGAIAQREAAAAASAASRTAAREATRAAQVAELSRIAKTIPSRYRGPTPAVVVPRQIPFRTAPPVPTVGALEQMAGVIQYGRPSPI